MLKVEQRDEEEEEKRGNHSEKANYFPFTNSSADGGISQRARDDVRHQCGVETADDRRDS